MSDPSPPRFYAPALDGLRAVAFGIVFLSHVSGLWMFPGGFGVTVFFFLSGYLITTLLRLEHDRTGRIDYRAFYARRFLRILPPYYLVLAGVVGLAAVGAFGEDEPIRPWPLLSQLAFYANYYIAAWGSRPMLPGTEVYWSLAVEEHFYLVFPFVAAALLSRLGPARSGWALVAVSAGVLAWRAALFLALDPGDARRITYATDTRIDSILLGAALALTANPALDPAPAGWTARRSAAAAGLALVGVAITLVPRDPVFRETVRYTLQGLLLVPVYHHLIAHPEGLGARLLSGATIRRIGALSYTLYLVHDALLDLVRHQLPGLPVLAGAALAGLASLAVAEAIHRGVERPLATLRARMRHVG